MAPRYQSERPLTLSEAHIIFGYTSDHLAYLCRKGFVWGQRHGRAWLTCEQAVADYKRALALAGRPVQLSQQAGLLRSKGGVGFRFDLEAILEAWDRFVDFGFTPKTTLERDPLVLLLACEKAETSSRKIGFWAGIFEADLIKWFFDCVGAYRGIFHFSKFTPGVFLHEAKRGLNVHLAQPPIGLPISRVPAYLGVLPWYRQEAVLVPALGALVFCLTVSQAALLSTFIV